MAWSSLEPRICSLETEYALICTQGATASAERERLVALLENAVLAGHAAVPCNSFGRRNTVRLPNGSEIRLREGYFIDNGSRFYYDAGHVEWANPETTDPRTAALYEKAAERNLVEALAKLNDNGVQIAPPSALLVKNNIDYSSDISYGCHENYSLRRQNVMGQDTFARLADDLVPFLVTRQLFCGAGRLGARRADPGVPVGFQLSQRADFMEILESLNTREARGILNQRDEPLADARRWRRLHVILGDSNVLEFATYLKLGTTSLVLSLIEANRIGGRWALATPLAALWQVSREGQTARLALRNGGTITALALQRDYSQLARQMAGDTPPQHWSHQAVNAWDVVLQDLEKGQAHLADRLDWIAKRHYLFDPLLTAAGVDWQEFAAWEFVLDQTRHLPPPAGDHAHPREDLQQQLSPDVFRRVNEHVTRCSLDWRVYPVRRRLAARLREVDFRYHDINLPASVRAWIPSAPDPACMLSEDEIRTAMHQPPHGTRAWQRGQIIVQAQVNNLEVQMDWDKVLLGASGRVLDMADPFADQAMDLPQLAGNTPPATPPSGGVRIKIIGVEHIAKD